MDVEVGKSACSDPGSIPGVSTNFAGLYELFSIHHNAGGGCFFTDGHGQETATQVLGGKTAHQGSCFSP
jgi:hypothetical protein